jgi:hypothetical protein
VFKRKLGLLGGSALVAVMLTAGCEESTIVYQGEEIGITEAEEMIADQLEVENPGLDLEVTITEDQD